MDELTGMGVFRQVVESGSFVGPADRLGVSTPMVSKRVMALEKRLRVRLLNRNSHKMSLTEPGQLYFERCKSILEDLQQRSWNLSRCALRLPASCVSRSAIGASLAWGWPRTLPNTGVAGRR